ncbi:terminase large subunit [Belliella pelovolcani]|uniref:Phage terminase-like protein, large subunit, contains N-terminal HTH domain n=1 Tax=Belliella pelovolcani TaxID=529505 RepID=A0A1N7MRG7_9BACT|nr:terminase TerL endonuclease subunit [Belliella pelovolcani]SIS88723.1 Phage terminase-like protein, large subunit, contains N-terminal HTH domain [Belliella pelovolcani]
MSYTTNFSIIDTKKYYFDTYTADRAVRFIETFCSHVKGDLAGKPYILQDWEKEIVSNIFGWKHRKTGLRKYREVFIFLPRKNSKTTLASAISLYMILADGEKGGEGYFLASTREQGRISFDIMSGMIRNSKELSKHLKIFRNSIEYEKDNSFFKVVASEAGSLHGGNLSFALVDEIHAHKDGELYEVVKTSMGARSQPLLISITTAGQDKNHIVFDLYDYSKKIINGIIKDETFLPIVFEGDDSDDIDKVLSIENIKKANPSYGKSIKEDYIIELINKARNIPSFLNSFKQLHLNIFVDSSSSWINNQDWMNNNIDYNEDDLLGETCWGGLDLANNRDLNSFVLIFPQPNGKIKTLNYTFIPYESAKRKDNIASGKAFIGWANNKNNLLYLTEPRSRDDDFIIEKIFELKSKFNIVNIAYDRWFSDQITTKLEAAGLKISSFGQGFKSMSPATKKTESLIIENKLLHNNNPILKWCISNVRIVKDDAGNVKMSKERSKEKIDSAVALVMAVGQYQLDIVSEMIDEENNKSPYNDGGFFFI